MKFPIHTALVLALIIAVFIFQFWLSKRDGKWPGLVLPVLCFIFSLLVPLNFVAPAESVDAGVVFSMILTWLISNIPTALMLLIYFSCREKLRRKRQLDKMNILDLY